jgi:hypothetical protein
MFHDGEHGFWAAGSGLCATLPQFYAGRRCIVLGGLPSLLVVFVLGDSVNSRQAKVLLGDVPRV